MPSPTDPTHEDNWSGGFYELSIRLGPADDAFVAQDRDDWLDLCLPPRCARQPRRAGRWLSVRRFRHIAGMA